MIAAAGFGGFTILRSTGKSDLMKYAGAVQMDLKDAQDESGLVSKNGKKYRYNEDIITLLCMGVDQGSESWEEARSEGENGQADAIFLAVLDQKAHSLKLIGISRDTMTDIATYDRQGNYVGESRNHLALAFSYGTSKQEGAELVKDAVSDLFYHLPIHGYVAIDWDALGKINDSVGGYDPGRRAVLRRRYGPTECGTDKELCEIPWRCAGKQQCAYEPAEDVCERLYTGSQRRDPKGSSSGGRSVSGAYLRYGNKYRCK